MSENKILVFKMCYNSSEVVYQKTAYAIKINWNKQVILALAFELS